MKFKKRTPPVDFGTPRREEDALFVTEPAAPAHAELSPPLILALDPEALEANVVAPPEQARAKGQLAPTTAPKTPVRHEAASAEALPKLPPAWPVYLVALAVAVLWALGPLAFAVGYRNGVQPLREDTFALVVFAMLAIGPAVFVFGCAYMIRQGQKLAAETRRAHAMAQSMLAPAISAAARAGDILQGVRDEIALAAAAADGAHDSMFALRAALAAETQLLVESADLSIRSAHELAGTLGRERSEMGVMAKELDGQALRVSDTITHHAKMVAEASDLAETQLREAEATLSARAADLAAAAGEARDAARTAGEDLTRHIARLETAGTGVAEQVRAVESGLGDQRNALMTLVEALKSDHRGFAEQAETHAATLSDFIGQARLSATEMNDRALKGGDSLRQLMADAAAQFRDLAETAHAEREEFGQSTLQSLEAVSAAAAEQRAQLEAQSRAAIDALSAAAEETREAAARNAASAREQVEQLSEAAFAAGQKANQVFEARLGEARALVAQSSEMVDQAGAATARKLEDGAAAARESLAELQEMMTELEQRAAGLPVTARNQIELVQAAVAKGMDELAEQARRTAEEAQAIDEAFQERVRRNFEMLSEAVRLMGSAATTPAPLAPPPRPARQRAAPAPEPAETAADLPDMNLDDIMEPVVPAKRPPSEAARKPAAKPELRPRLKLTPTATDEEFASVFEAAGGITAEPAEGADGESWTWKDLLASIDGADAEGERLQDLLGAELDKMGVEPGKLLPKARIDEIAAAVQTGDLEGARAVVTRLAPAATRRIARRLFTDDEVRRQVQVYTRRYQTLVDDAVVRDPEGFLMASLLGDDAGRLYLLLDAAQGDMV